jgi:hypothetical protein
LTLAPELSSDCNQLYDAISKQIKLPARPLLYIKGTHTESNNNKKEKNSNTVTDFDFSLDLAETLLTGWEDGRAEFNWMRVEIIHDDDQKSVYRGGIIRSRAYKSPTRGAVRLSEDNEALLAAESGGDQEDRSIAGKSLRLWCERFCNDPAPVKSYDLPPYFSSDIQLTQYTDSPSIANWQASTQTPCATSSPHTSANSTTAAQ